MGVEPINLEKHIALFTCNQCGAQTIVDAKTLPPGALDDEHNHLDGWAIEKVRGEWANLCPGCAAMFRKGQL